MLVGSCDHSVSVRYALRNDSVATLIVSGLYLVFYTGYSKRKRRLDWRQLVYVLTVRHTQTTCRELNKVAGLAGLTLLALSYWSDYFMWYGQVRVQASLLLLAHALYSVGSFYRWDPRALYTRNSRWLAIVCGQLALAILLIHHVLPLVGVYVTLWPLPVRASVLRLVLAILHFYGMEVRPGPWQGELNVRPFAYTAFALPCCFIQC